MEQNLYTNGQTWTNNLGEKKKHRGHEMLSIIFTIFNNHRSFKNDTIHCCTLINNLRFKKKNENKNKIERKRSQRFF